MKQAFPEKTNLSVSDGGPGGTSGYQGSGGRVEGGGGGGAGSNDNEGFFFFFLV